jgi:hypothetical protein
VYQVTSTGIPVIVYCRCIRYPVLLEKVRVYSKIFPVGSIGASSVMNRKVHSKNIHLTGSVENST